MYYALDSNGNRIHIIDAAAGQEYICPVCGSKLMQKKGKVNAWHYAHYNHPNCDDWYDINEWHSDWENMFPAEYREIVIEKDGEKHRADIKIGKLILKFQDRSLSGYEFECRVDFFSSIGKLVWVVNLLDKSIYERNYSSGKTAQYEWPHAYKFNNLDAYGSNFDLFFHIDEDMLITVVWNKQGFKYFGGYQYSKEEFMNYLRAKYKKMNS